MKRNAETQEALCQVVLSCIAEVAAVQEPDLCLKTRFMEDLGLTSLDLLTVLMMVEDQLQQTLPEPDLRALATVGDLVTWIKRDPAAEVFTGCKK